MRAICRVQDCEQPISNKKTELCHKHHLRFIRGGDTELRRVVVDKQAKCKVDGCNRNNQTSIGTCLMHYKRWKRYGTFELPKRNFKSSIKCKFCDKVVGRDGSFGMCGKHYQMWKLHGDPLYIENKRNNPQKRGYIRDTNGKEFHRTIAEEKLGRKLIKGVEVVHHIDLNKLNNNPNNLIVLTKSEHTTLHQQLNKVAGELIRIGVIIYKEGRYQPNI